MSDLEGLVGAWRLVSFGITMADTKIRTQPFGPHPDGRMVLEPGGRIMFMFMSPDRSPPQSDADRVKLFKDMFAYSGRVRVASPGCMITSVDLSWNPDWQGEQTRFFTLDGNRLVITTPEQLTTFSDRRLVGDLVWEREP